MQGLHLDGEMMLKYLRDIPIQLSELYFPATVRIEDASAALQHLAAVAPELELRIQQAINRLLPHHLSGPKDR